MKNKNLALLILFGLVSGLVHGQYPITGGEILESALKKESSSRIVEYQPGHFLWIGNWAGESGFLAKYPLFGPVSQLDSANLVGTSTF